MCCPCVGETAFHGLAHWSGGSESTDPCSRHHIFSCQSGVGEVIVSLCNQVSESLNIPFPLMPDSRIRPHKSVDKPRWVKNMTQIITHTLLWLLCMPVLLAGPPKVEGLKLDERVSITLMYSEPTITEYKYVFSGSEVTISENGKTLGKLVITAEDAARIDQHLWAVERGKKAGRSVLGAPVYTINYEDSGKTIGTWTYRITESKESSKPTLSLGELRKRLP